MMRMCKWVLFGSLLATPAFSQEVSIEECLQPEADLAKFDFDPKFAWFQSKEEIRADFEFSETSKKALADLNGFFEAHDTKFVLAVMPSPLFGRPAESQILADRIEETGLDRAYFQTHQTLNGIGIRAPDLLRLHANFPPDAVQRKVDSHLSPFGAWAAAALIAESIQGNEMESSAFPEVMERMDNLSTRTTSYKPSGRVKSALDIDCLRKFISLEEIDYFEEQRLTDEADLFGESAPERTEVTLVGTSYSQIMDGAIGRAIDFFSQKVVANRSVNGGGVLTSFELALREYTEETLSSEAFVWEVPSPNYINRNNPLSALMVAKGAVQDSCTSESALFESNMVELDDKGVGIIPLDGVLEDRLEIDFPMEAKGEILIGFAPESETEKTVKFKRSFEWYGADIPEYKNNLSLWLPGYDWFPNEVQNNHKIRISVKSDLPLGNQVKYRTCATKS